LRHPGPRSQQAWEAGAWWLFLLWPAEALFRAAVALRRQAYRWRLLPAWRAPVPVVVVGNLVVGGSGKTPLVIALAEALTRAGCRVGIVSRGYGADRGTFPYRVHEDSGVEACGDEALLIFRRTGCPVVVAPNRSEAVQHLLSGATLDIVLSDDGLQHYALARDLEIALVDGRTGDGNGNGHCLPAGPLREPLSRLASADWVVERGGADPATALHYRADALVNLASGERAPPQPGELGADIYAVAGIGRPGQFIALLRESGFNPEARLFPDHHRFTAGDLAGLADRPVIMTEKDAVKCSGFAGDNCWYLRIDAIPPAGLVADVIALARSRT